MEGTDWDRTFREERGGNTLIHQSRMAEYYILNSSLLVCETSMDGVCAADAEIADITAIYIFFASTALLSLSSLNNINKMATKTPSKQKQSKQSKQPKQPKQPKQQPQQPSLVQQFANFTKTTAGLEKTLRLIQALAQIIAEVSSHDVVTAARWSTAKSQLALSELPWYLI